jgi:Flp pilus assembly pilin Flp
VDILKKIFLKLMRDERGGVTETAIILAIMAVIAIGGLTFLGPKIKDMFTKAGNQLDSGNAYTY